MKKSQKNRKMILVAFTIVIEIMLNACGKENEQVVNNQGKHAEYEKKLEDKREIDLDFKQEIFADEQPLNMINSYEDLNVATYITKLDDTPMYFISDCYHDQILYNDNIDDEISSLSAILLNDSYYEVLKNGIKLIDGLSVLSVESLVLFKIKAWLDLSNRKLQGENIDSSDIKKHKNDIFRLSTLILGTETLSLPEEVKSDVVDFCKKMETETVDLKNLNIKTTKDSIIQRYKTIFDV